MTLDRPGRLAILLTFVLCGLPVFLGCGNALPVRSSAGEQSVFATAQLNDRLLPLDRGARYEDPLDAALREAGLGETDGGGTMQLASGEIEYIDVGIVLNDTDEGVPFVIERLESFGAPAGSVLIVSDTDPPRRIPFGRVEGVAVYLDGVGLPDDVYATSDVNLVIEQLDAALAGRGEMQSYWEGPEETALYFYGQSAEEMKRLMRPFMDTYPLCEGARVVTIAPIGNDSAPER